MVNRSLRRALLALCLALPLVAAAQRFVLTPGSGAFEGEPVGIVLEALAPGETVELSTRRQVSEWDGKSVAYGARARFRADAEGRIDLARAAPLDGGSYSGADLRGLFWSMDRLGEAAGHSGSESELAAGEVRLVARRESGDKERGERARTTITLRSAAADVQSRAADGFEGARFFHRGSGAGPAVKRPALILLGGSEGGARIVRDGPVFATRGYAVLALPYYSPPGWGASGPTSSEFPSLPAAFADIPVERLDAARAWLARQPEVDANRIGVVGTSKGAEFALLAGVKLPWIKAIVANVPSDVVWEGWGPGVVPGTRSSFAWQGEPLPFVPYKDFDKELDGFRTGAEVRIRRPQDAGRAAHPARVVPARIAVERIAAPVLVIGGHDDQVWDSGGMAEAIVAARSAAGRETVAVIARDAGHPLGGNGWQPSTRYNDGPSKVGGTPAGNARTQARAWAATWAFLDRTLGPLRTP